MRPMIIGATGQLGSEFIRYFSQKGIDTIQTSSSKKNNNFIQLDITDLKSVKETIKETKPTTVINCSAYNLVDKAEEDWETAFSVNGLGVRNLAIVCQENNIPLVHYSTDYVFDGNKKQPYTIADKENPLSMYGQSKLLGEQFIKSLCSKYILIRVSWVFGKSDYSTNFIKKFLNWAGKGEAKISIDEISAPTYTKDIVEVTNKLIEMEAFGLYHLSNEGECSRFEYAKFITDTLKLKVKLLEAYQDDFKLPAKRPKYSKLSNFGIYQTVGIQVKHWKDAVIEYLKEEGML
jgi:dTDP-4-dehydrorhamnose reductase